MWDENFGAFHANCKNIGFECKIHKCIILLQNKEPEYTKVRRKCNSRLRDPHSESQGKLSLYKYSTLQGV